MCYRHILYVCCVQRCNLRSNLESNLKKNAGSKLKISTPTPIPFVKANAPEEEMATHFSILAGKNPMDREAWQATVHDVAKNLT